MQKCGMTVSSDLSWSTHVNTICAKANQKLDHENLKGTPEELKCLAYITLVRSGYGICMHCMGSQPFQRPAVRKIGMLTGLDFPESQQNFPFPGKKFLNGRISGNCVQSIATKFHGNSS